MTNKERLDANNQKIEEIRQTLARKQVSPTDMLQARVDSNNDCSYLFYKYTGTDLSFIKNLDTSNVTNMESMFYGCERITALDVSNFDTSKNLAMTNMFYSCKALTSLDLSNFNTSNVSGMSYIFQNCIALTSLDLSRFDTSKVKSMSYMFSGCQALTTLDVSNFNTSNVTSMNNMFDSCSRLETLDLSSFNTSNVKDMRNMFYGCYSLTSLDLSSFDTSNVTNMQWLFGECTNLTNIIGTLDVIKNTTMNSMFYNCINLENVTLKNIKINLTLGSGTTWGTKISNATLINTIQELWDLTGSTSKKLTLSTDSKNNIANIYVKLIDVTDEMLEQDPNAGNKKPCVVCESTDEGAMTITEYAISKNWAIA